MDDLNQIGVYLFEEENERKKISHYTYLFVVKKEIDKDMIVIQGREVEEIKFVDKEEFKRMLQNGEMD